MATALKLPRASNMCQHWQLRPLWRLLGCGAPVPNRLACPEGPCKPRGVAAVPVPHAMDGLGHGSRARLRMSAPALGSPASTRGRLRENGNVTRAVGHGLSAYFTPLLMFGRWMG